MTRDDSAHMTEPGSVDEFVAAWQRDGAPPRIAAYLPDTAEIRRSALVELIRIDLQHRWLRAGLSKRLVDYCDEFPELTVDSLPAPLIYDEFVIRRQSGNRIDPRDYLAEYPTQADQLRLLLIADDDDPSTQLAPAALADDGTVTALDLTATAAAPEFTATVASPDFSATATARGVRTAFAEPGSAEALDEIEVGDSIDDFDLLTTLGSGAFARVFLARQRSIQRLVAVKISADHGTETQTLAQLDHDYIVRIFDQRVLPERKLKLLYMQFVPGGTLLGVLKWIRATPIEQRDGRLLLSAIDAAMEEKGELRPTDSSVRAELAALSWPETVAWLGRRLADALDYAGSRGVLHRDVKPANILLTAEGIPKLADFNISFSRNVSGDNAVAYFGGSLSYMSPEQLEACHPGHPGSAADLDTRSDIYSLGVVLWELLTGRKPFDDRDIKGDDATVLDGMLATRRAGVSTAALADLPVNCPAALCRVLLACLAPDRANRWSTGTELTQQFDLCMDARARDLVDPPPGSWRLRLSKWMVPIVTLAIGIPNLLASLYNIHHNQTLIVDRLSPQSQHQFILITQLINFTFFPLGAVLIVYWARHVITVPFGLRKGRIYDQKLLAKARSDVLLLGDRVVLVVFALWLLSGLLFPVTLEIVGGGVPTGAYIHFIASISVCGAIAVAYPFFLVTFYLVRCVYPHFLPYGATGPADARNLRGLDRRSNLYLAVAASVPLLGVAGITFLEPSDIPEVIVAVRILCIGAIVAFVFTYWVFRMLEQDLRALERVMTSQSPQ